jgi:hypothetical protein
LVDSFEFEKSYHSRLTSNMLRSMDCLEGNHTGTQHRNVRLPKTSVLMKCQESRRILVRYAMTLWFLFKSTWLWCFGNLCSKSHRNSRSAFHLLNDSLAFLP